MEDSVGRPSRPAIGHDERADVERREMDGAQRNMADGSTSGGQNRCIGSTDACVEDALIQYRKVLPVLTTYCRGVARSAWELRESPAVETIVQHMPDLARIQDTSGDAPLQ